MQDIYSATGEDLSLVHCHYIDSQVNWAIEYKIRDTRFNLIIT